MKRFTAVVSRLRGAAKKSLSGSAPGFLQGAAMACFALAFWTLGVFPGLLVTALVLGVVGWAVDQ